MIETAPRRRRRAHRHRAGLPLRARRLARVQAEGRLMGAFLKTPEEWPLVLTGRAAALSGNAGDLDARRPQRRLRGAAQGRPRPRRHRHHRDRRRRRACAAAAGRASPTGAKWRAAANQPAGAALRRRQRLRRRPGPSGPTRRSSPRTRATLIEGIAIAAFAIGATEAIIAVRADDTALVTLLEGAILAAEEARLPRRQRPRHRLPGHRHRPARPGRVRAGRGDRPAQGARGPPRPARPAAALSHRDGPVRQAHRGQQRRDARRRARGSWPTARAAYAAIGSTGQPRHRRSSS